MLASMRGACCASALLVVACSAAPSMAPRKHVRELSIHGEHGSEYAHLDVANPDGDCVTIDSSSDVRLIDVHVGPCKGRGIHVVDSSRVHVESTDVRPAFVPAACCDAGAGILLERVDGFTLRHSRLEQAESLVEIIASRRVELRTNELVDPIGAFPRGHAVQLQQASRDITVAQNSFHCRREHGCRQQDAVNIYAASDVHILDNTFDGGASANGCSVLVDGFGASRVEIKHNAITAATDGRRGGCGVGIAGGVDIDVADNTVTGYGNVGYYVWAQPATAVCQRVSLTGNRAGDGEARGGRPWTNVFWNGGGCTDVRSTANTWDHSPPR